MARTGTRTNQLLHLALIGIAYLAAAKIGLLFVLQPEGLAGIWPASGVALAALLLNTRPIAKPDHATSSAPNLLRWREILIVIFVINTLSNLSTGNILPVSLGFAFANTLEPAFGAWVFTRLIRPRHLNLPVTFERLSDILRLIVVAVFANGLTALVGALVPTLAFGASYFDIWQIWWIEDGLGILFVTPLFMTWAPSVRNLNDYRPSARPPAIWIEGIGTFALLGAATWAIFSKTSRFYRFEPHPYMLFPILIWIGLRYRPRGAASSLALMAAIALLKTSGGASSYPLGGQTPADRLILVQMFLCVAGLAELVLASIFCERKQAEAELRVREAALRESEATLRASQADLLKSQATLLKSTADLKKSQRIAQVGSWTWDTTTNQVIWSDEMYTIFGVSSRREPGTDGTIESLNLAEMIDQAIHPDDRERVERSNNRVRVEQQPAPMEYRVVWPDGSVHTVLATPAEEILDEHGKILMLGGIVQDISTRKAQEEALRASEAHFRLLVETAPDPIYIQTNGRFAYVNQSLLRLTGATCAEDLLGRSVFDHYDPNFHNIIRDRIRLLTIEKANVPAIDEIFLRLDGSPVTVEVSAVPFVYQGEEGALVFLRDTTERRLAIKAMETSERQLKLFVEYAPAAIAMFDREMHYIAASRRYLSDYRLGLTEITGRSHYDVFPEVPQRWKDIHQCCLNGATEMCEEDPFPRADGTLDWVRWEIHPWYDGSGTVGGIILFSEVITERKQSREALRKANQSLARAQRIAHLGSWEDDLTSGELFWSDEMYELMGYPAGQPLNMDVIAQGFSPAEYERFKMAVARTLTDNSPYSEDYAYTRPDGEQIYIHDEGEVVYDEHGTPVWMYGTTLDITQRKQAEMEIQRQFARLQGLRRIDQAVVTSLDLDFALDVLLEQVVEQLQVDAASVLLYNPQSQILNYKRGRGFRTRQVEATHLALGQSFAGQIAETREPVMVWSLADMIDGQPDSLFANEGFCGYIGLPLIARGQVKGVLEIFQRSPLNPNLVWLGYLDILSGQAAIAVDNLQMMDDLQRANWELEKAYDTTIEGWSRALDLRDKETEGHSQRVMELTMNLARAMGLPEAGMVHLYRGALLHDIGKMGVPDQILLKAGSLTADEWVKMRQHPQFALDLLSPIGYLRDALDIPFCHHEKWDGTGYPRGLKGEDIPLAARIFAIADVYDALTSDRPYRLAWSEERTIEYIKNQTGQHFDPAVVTVFMDIIGQK